MYDWCWQLSEWCTSFVFVLRVQNKSGDINANEVSGSFLLSQYTIGTCGFFLKPKNLGALCTQANGRECFTGRSDEDDF